MSSHVTAPPKAPSARRAPSVLVVDDSEEMRQLLEDVLTERGYRVTTAPSAARALELLASERPDLIVTDLLMPGMSGFSLRSLMLRRPELSTIPVVVVSAYWRRPSETLDVVEVLGKPLNVDRLLEVVQRVAPLRAS